jgi:hypothetical protein
MRKNNTVSCLLFHKMAALPERHFSGRSYIHFLTQTYQLCYTTENNFVEQRPSSTANGLLSIRPVFYIEPEICYRFHTI